MATTFEPLAQGLISLVDWGLGILFILLVWEVIQLIRSVMGKSESTLTDWNKSPVLTALGFNDRGKRNSMTKLLNEYIEEEKELQLIDEIRRVVNETAALSTEVQAAGQISKEQCVIMQRNVARDIGIHSKLNDAITHLRRMSRKQVWRQEREMGKYLDKLEAAKVDVSRVRSLESDILKKHKDTADLLEQACSFWEKSSVKHNSFLASLLKSAKTPWPIKIKPAAKAGNGLKLATALTEIDVALKSDELVKKLGDAEKKQKSAIQDVQGIKVESRELFKDDGSVNTQ